MSSVEGNEDELERPPKKLKNRDGNNNNAVWFLYKGQADIPRDVSRVRFDPSVNHQLV